MYTINRNMYLVNTHFSQLMISFNNTHYKNKDFH